MKILVTGGCGYKGTVLVPKLLAQGHKVIVVDVMWFGNYLSDHENLTVIQADVRQPQDAWFTDVDAVIHLASVANDPCCDLEPKLSWETSALATMLLVEKAIKHQVKQFIYASSGSVYGISDEPQVTETTELNPISEYNKAKMVAERVLLSYQDKILVSIIRPATVCGYSPRMRLDVSVNMLTMQALKNGLITVFGGTQTRPNIHIDDITDLYLYLLDKKITGVFNAGFENISILDIAERVKQNVATEITVTPNDSDPRSYRLNSDKLLATGFKPKKTVNDAIQELMVQFNAGVLVDKEDFYNIRTMKKMAATDL